MKQTNRSAHKVALLGMLAAFALILGWVEHVMPVVIALPGIKLGLGNIAILLALELYGEKEALTLTVVKVTLSALLFGSISGLVYSAAGGILSFITMSLLRRTKLFSPVGISAAGGCAHVAAQVATAVVMTSTAQVWLMLSPLLLAAILCGTLTGMCARFVLVRLSGRFALEAA